jgi:hypothetical protein
VLSASHRGATCEKWSKKYQWQKRIREMLVEDAKRSARAADQAALNVATELERERLKFQQRAIEVWQRAIERGLEILKCPVKGSKPGDAVRLFAVAYQIGADALGLAGGGQFGLHPSKAPIINVVIKRDAHSKKVKQYEDEFFARHPEIRRPKNGFEGIN